MVPYILLVYLSTKRNGRTGKLYIDFIFPLMLVFLYWAALSTMLIPLRYSYPTNAQLVFSLLKLGKLSFYTFAAILTMKALLNPDIHLPFQWSVLIAGVLVGSGLLLSQNHVSNLTSLGNIGGTSNGNLYQENPTSAMLAILIAFIAGLVIARQGSPRWRRFASLGLIVMVLGLFMASGRGGWVALLVAMLYLLSRVDFRRTLALAVLASAIGFFAYNNYPQFRDQVDRTLNPDPTYLQTYNAGVFGVDDGERFSLFEHSLPQILESPFLGRGFFHRGGLSGIYGTGSHNFFLQMFLETGIPGGCLILVILRQMWQHAGTAYGGSLKLPVRAALIAAFVSGLSGEYFYGGTILFALFLTYAPVGSASLERGKLLQTRTVALHLRKAHAALFHQFPSQAQKSEEAWIP